MMVSAAAMLFRVLPSALLVFLVLMGTVNSQPVCKNGCKLAKHHCPHFRHVSELKDSSIAPWTLVTKEGSEPDLRTLEVAECKPCRDTTMVAKPITIEVYVSQRIRNGTEHNWCQCPIEVPVGCTCVAQ